MKLIVNHKGAQSLVVSKPDIAILEKARGLLILAATHFDLTPEAKNGIATLIDSTIAAGTKAVNEQQVLFDKDAVDDENDDQPPA